MKDHALTAIVSLLSLLLYAYMGVRVGQARAQFSVPAPAITGNTDFERVFRVQANTLEWLPIFLTSIWLFSLYWDDRVAAVYLTGYSKAANTRSTGFLIQLAATAILLFGALGKILWGLVAPSA
jgi:glutathione S-transferase